MGKRKAKTKPPPKKRMDKLDTVFSCPFCNHGSSVECRIIPLKQCLPKPPKTEELSDILLQNHAPKSKPKGIREGRPKDPNQFLCNTDALDHASFVHSQEHRDMKNSIGEAICMICQESFSTTVTALTEPIDIYSEWIDECELANNVDDDGAE